VRDLGVVLDVNMSMDDHVTSMCKVCFYYLKAIGRQSYYMDKRSRKTLVQALILTRLDYCAALLTSITKKQEMRMQRVLNYAVRMVERIPRCMGVAQKLIDLQWLTIKKRITFRTLILVYSAVHSGRPKTLANLVILKSHDTYDGSMNT
jgi:hypothetical protein